MRRDATWLAEYNARRGVGNVEPVKLVADPDPDAPEREILNIVLRALKKHPKVAWAERMNTGRKGRIRFGFVGLSDIIGQLKTGEFLAVECKRRNTQPTTEQVEFLGRVHRAGGKAFVARWVDDVAAALDDDPEAA